MALNDDYSFLNSVSAHPKRLGDTSNLNPAFATPMANAIRQARAAGLNVGLESGFRAPSQTGSAYDAGGNSSHSYGLAGDVSGLDGPNGKVTNQWAQIATANGLHNPYGVSDAAEFNHWQLPEQPLEKNPQLLASLKQASATGDIHNVWSAFNAGGGPSRVASTTPGTTLYSSPMDMVANLESGNRNIAQQIQDKNSAAGTPAGGFFQIIDPTWRTAAAAAGVDVNQYPTAMSAPRNIQAQVASAIPVNQWGPNTVAALKAKYPGIDTSQTLGAFQSAAINPSGAPPSAASAPAAPAAPGRPGQAPVGLAGSLPGFQANSPGAKMTAAGLKQLGSGDQGAGGGEEPQAPPLQMAQAHAIGGPMMMGPGGQNTFGQRAAEQSLAQQGYMMQPSLAAFTPAPGQPPVPSTIASQMPGTATGMPSLPGTTLNSPSQLQMALMSGSISPYDMYARSAAAATYGGSLGS